MGKKVIKWDFRDVSSGIAKLREILLGRKYVYHNRFPPLISPRTIPPPDIPRGPEYKYSNQWYGNRNVMDSVKPPVVAPIAEGLAGASKKSSTACGAKPVEINFPCPPTPGTPWWFDGHCYYVQRPVPRPHPRPPPPPCDPDPPCPQTKHEAQAPEPPCPPCPPTEPPPCDPCKPPNK